VKALRSNCRGWRRPAFALLAVLGTVSITVAGCGNDRESEPVVEGSPPAPGTSTTGSPLPPNIVTEVQVQRAKPRSPDRSVLLWWQAIQFQDASSVLDYTTPRVLRTFGRGRLTRLTRAVGPALGGLEVVHTRVYGKRATSRAAILTYERGEPKRTATLPFSLQLALEQGRWKVDDVRYLNTLARSFKVR